MAHASTTHLDASSRLSRSRAITDTLLATCKNLPRAPAAGACELPPPLRPFYLDRCRPIETVDVCRSRAEGFANVLECAHRHVLRANSGRRW